MLRINIGCGQTPTIGWKNFDNSFSLRLSKIPLLTSILRRLRMLEESQSQFVTFARKNKIEYGDATKRLPLDPESCEVVYSSHMLEHLDRAGAVRFLQETYRVLCANGVLRIVVPDINKLVGQYNAEGDADAFIESTHLCVRQPSTLIQKVKYVMIGTRHHQWMYDGDSLSRLLRKHGFADVAIMPVGKTQIPEPGALDLTERSSESVYVEAKKPAACCNANKSPSRA